MAEFRNITIEQRKNQKSMEGLIRTIKEQAQEATTRGTSCNDFAEVVVTMVALYWPMDRPLNK
jgi:hypothetical protein